MIFIIIKMVVTVTTLIQMVFVIKYYYSNFAKFHKNDTLFQILAFFNYF